VDLRWQLEGIERNKQRTRRKREVGGEEEQQRGMKESGEEKIVDG
jgi:hypothetical protein